MKTHYKDNQAQANSLKSKAFSTQASGKMFNMVISGLYSDKPQSITREIWSNAYDAHRDAGCPDKPFDVTFPTIWAPEFRCRDYGPGISPDQMEGLYTELGGSTKEDTNNAVGKWGVGRMSPMSYTDVFSVTSWYNGYVTHYSVQMGSDGVPQLHVLSDTIPSDKPSGIEISFPVERYDVGEFANAAKRVSWGFEVKPNVLNPDAFDGWPEVHTIIKKDRWSVVSGVNGSYAKMGCVIYPMDIYQTDGLIESARGILQDRTSGRFFEFDIGDLEVTVSRESLQYGKNTYTQENIAKLLNKVAAEIEQTYLDEIANAKTEYEANVIYNSMSGVSYQIINAIKKKAVYDGKSINGYVSIDPAYRYSFDWSNTSDYSLRYHKVPSFSCDQSKISATPGKVVYIQNITKGKKDLRASGRIKQHYLDNDYKDGALWVKVDEDHPDFQNYFTHVTTLFGDDLDFILVSDIPDPGAASNGPRKKTKVKQYIPNGTWKGYKVVFWDDKDITDQELEDGGYYLKIRSNEPLDDECLWAEMWDVLQNQGVVKSTDVLWVVPATYWKKFEGDHWSRVVDVFNKWLGKNWFQIEKDVLHSAHQSLISPKIKKLNNYYTPKSGPLKDYLGYFDTNYKPKHTLDHTLLRVYKDYEKLKTKQENISSEVEKLFESVQKTYPMLYYFSERAYTTSGMEQPTTQQWVEYIEMVNKQKGIN